MLSSLVFLAVLQALDARLAADLSPGLELHYSAAGRAAPPWVIDSVNVVQNEMAGASACVRFLMRRSPDQPPAETSLCLRSDTLFGWDARRSEWLPQRPVGPNMTFILVRPNGDTVRYSTALVTRETISEVELSVLPTTVLTVDSLGRPKRRLRERYALSLATASGGVFEAPDSSASRAWRVEQVFALTRIARRDR